MSFMNVLLAFSSPYTVILIILMFAYRVLRNHDILYRNPWNNGLLLLFLWSLIVGFINKQPLSSTASLGLLIYFLFSIYIQNYYNDEKKIGTLLKNLVLFSIASAFIGIAEKITSIYSSTIWWGSPFGIPSQVASAEYYRIYSNFGNPNIAGTWFAAIIIVCLYLYDDSKKFKSIFYAALTCLFSVMLFLTGSRGAALGLFLGLGVYGLFKRNKKNILLIGPVFIFVLFSMFAYQYLTPQQAATVCNTSVSHAVSDSASGRGLIWLSSINMFKLKPFTGWGLLGTYFADSSIYLYHKREFHAHNIWLTVISALGVVGLAIYVYMRYNLYKELKMLWDSGCSMAPLFIAVQAVIIGHGFVDFPAMTPHGGIIFFGSSALVYTLAMKYRSSSTHDYYSLNTIFSKGKTRRHLQSIQKI